MSQFSIFNCQLSNAKFPNELKNVHRSVETCRKTDLGRRPFFHATTLSVFWRRHSRNDGFKISQILLVHFSWCLFLNTWRQRVLALSQFPFLPHVLMDCFQSRLPISGQLEAFGERLLPKFVYPRGVLLFGHCLHGEPVVAKIEPQLEGAAWL